MSVQQGSLFIVATPIGNVQDITLRGARVLREVDAVICEERRAASTLLAQLGIEKPLLELNEHSSANEVQALLERLQNGARLALISDHGTPLIQDPGADLVNAAIQTGIRIEPIPGASSILAALVASGIAAPRFRFLGQLPPKREERKRVLQNLRRVRQTMILLDAPYRLLPLLEALREEFGKGRRAAVACNLTMPDETFVRGTLQEIFTHFTKYPFKGEFVIVVEGT